DFHVTGVQTCALPICSILRHDGVKVGNLKDRFTHALMLLSPRRRGPGGFSRMIIRINCNLSYPRGHVKCDGGGAVRGTPDRAGDRARPDRRPLLPAPSALRGSRRGTETYPERPCAPTSSRWPVEAAR